jgi:acetolactate synthase I/II/III large subunit
MTIEFMMMKVSTYIAHFLKSKEINTVFELQGGMITRILDELYKLGGFNIVSMHHEQGAAFAADAYARVTGKPGVAMATSGPGATNLITGIGSCFFDSVPAIFITGQVNLNEQKGSKLTRQIGFQETDIVEIVKPITKAAYAIKSAEEVPSVFEEAYRLSLSGRPGPVLIDIPMNIQQEIIDESLIIKSIPGSQLNERNLEPIALFIDKLISAISESKKPLILAGRGVRAANAINKFHAFIEKYNLPVVTSLLGLDAIPYNHPNRIGFIGTYGNRWANYALGNCDLLIALGTRLDLRQTGSDVESFQKNKKIFHVDCDPVELNNSLQNCETLNTDLNDFLDYALNKDIISFKLENWVREITTQKKKLPDTQELGSIKGINPNKFIHALSKNSVPAKAFITDVGNNQMWAAQSIELYADTFFLSSGGMGAMGYSLPASIGASISLGNAPVVSISGDGGFQINIQELQTIKRNNLPVKIIILNNHCLGMIRQFQDAYFNSCYQSTVWGYSSPDFEKLGQAYGIESKSISKEDEIEEALNWLWINPYAPALLHVHIDVFTNAYPKTAFGKPITDMEPFIEP